MDKHDRVTLPATDGLCGVRPGRSVTATHVKTCRHSVFAGAPAMANLCCTSGPSHRHREERCRVAPGHDIYAENSRDYFAARRVVPGVN
jgi:hypothetical protein